MICTSLTVLFVSRSGAQTRIPVSDVISTDLIFEQYNSRNGLPDDRMRALFQDSNGFLWVGTMNGLARYDGYSFTNYYHENGVNSLAGSWTNAICEAADHSLWIGTKEGLSRFDPRRKTFTNYRNITGKTNSLLHNQINSLVFDNAGQLWIATPEGLTVFNPATQTFRRFSALPLTTRISRLLRSNGDVIWMTTNEGLVKYHTQTDTFDFFPLTARLNPFGDRFSSLLEVNHDLYVGSFMDGLFRLHFDEKTGRYGAIEPMKSFVNGRPEKRDLQILDLCQAKSGTIWLATNNGVARIDQIVSGRADLHYFQHNLTNGQSLSNNTVYKILIDRTDVLWCGTENGLNKTDLQLLPFTYYTFFNQHAQDQVRSIYSSTGETIWFGTVKSGLYRYNAKTGATQHIRFSPTDSFLNEQRAIYPDADGSLLLGTLGGAIRLSANASAAQTVDLPGLATYAFLTDSRKNQWIGTNVGLYRKSPNGKSNQLLLNGKTGKSNFVRAIYEDHTGMIWVGYENAGLYCLNPTTGVFRQIAPDQAKQRLAGNTVFTILEYPRNVLWVGTDAGLNKLTLAAGNTYQLKTYAETDGLPAQAVNSMLPDGEGNLWLGTIKGLARFSPRQEQFRIYLRGSSFRYNGGCRLTDDKLLFGTSDGFVIFDPGAIHPVSSVPPVALTELKVVNNPVTIGQVINGDTLLRQDIGHTPSITLNHLNNVLTLGFSALHFSNPARNAYAFKLEGFDKDWVYTNAQNRSATYTNLDPGTYRFRVKAANYLGQWSPIPALLTVTVLPAPWKSNWAIATYLLLFVLALLLIVRYLLIQSRQRQLLAFTQREKEQQDRLYRFKLQFFTDVSHEFRTPLSLISGPIEDLVLAKEVQGAVRQKVEYVQRNTRKLLQLIDELMTFQKMDQGKLRLQLERIDLRNFIREVVANFELLAQQKGIEFRLVIEALPLHVPIDSDKLDKILTNLLFNAMKFTPAGGYVQLSVRVVPAATETSASNEWLCFAVEDNGKGITPDEQTHLFERFFQSETIKGGTGVGLSLAKGLVDLHKGQISVQSEPNVRTCFTVLLPVLPATAIEPIAADRVSMPVLPTKRPPLNEPPLPTDALRPASLLLVDDNVDVLNYLELTFQSQYTIRKAANGQEALRLIQQHEPDIVISDVSMPVMDGIELCRRLKTDLATSHIPFILLTARTAVESALEGLGAGADEYMAKPFHPGLLAVRVEKLVENRRQLIQKYQATGVLIPENISTNPLDQALLQKIIDTITINLDNEEFGVEALGECVNMSRSNLFRKLKAITGQTPIEFIYNIRLTHALALLLERKLNISEITNAVGFKTRSSFTKSFRKHYGKAPTEYLNDILANKAR
ncbi:two-component regulator propeller domain-containing protein [Spirosoma pulveris]